MFFWLDDAPMYSEQEVLREHNDFDKLIKLNTRKNQNDLRKAIDILKLK